MLFFHVGGFLILYALLRLQAGLPFNPADMSAVPPDLSFNTAVSFVTNTNWQNYGGESTLSYLVQMLGLTHQNFLSAATGIVLAVALIRGFARASMRTIGNFWVDITRCTLYILLPICIVYALFLVWQGIPQTLGPYVEATTLEGAKQTIAVGPVASQIAIKMLGTNGGGFFNANAAHPFENPTALSNFVQMISIFAIGAALTNVFGRMVGNQRQGWAILAVMGVLFIAGVAVAYWAEAHGNDAFTAMGLTGGNMEGKEVRFGIVASALFAVITTAASCGAVNAMHDSFTALGGMIPLINMQLGEIIVGGVGAGMYGMLLFVILAIFVAGLMVGRTPEYVGKKIEAKEVKMAMLAILILPLMYLGWTAVAVVYPTAVASMANPGPHGFTEVLYAYTSQTANNGSAFGGLTGNILFYNVTGAVAMLVGRFWMIIPAMAIAGSLAEKKSVPPSAGTFPTTGGLFVGLVVGVIVILGGLTFFPALALGPIVEHLAMNAGTLFSMRIDVGATSMETSTLRKQMPVSALFDPKIVVPAIGSAFVKLDPRVLMKNPVMFVLEVVTALTTIIFVRDLVTGGENIGFEFQIVLWLWFTVLFANFAEAIAEGRGKAQADALRRTRTETQAKLLTGPDRANFSQVPGTNLKVGDVVLVEAGDTIPSDGEVIEGIASVNEAAITGESAPVIRESGGDRSAVTGGTQVLSDWIKVRITAAAGLDLPRPHDQAGRGRRAAEDAERDRAQYPAGRPDHHLRVRDRDHPELRRLCRRRDLGGDPGGAVRDLDPDHHRRAAVGDRHRRHGPPRALQRAGGVGPRGRGGRRRRHAAARQDRHHHARQPAGDRVQAAARRDRAGAGGRRAARLARR